VCKLAKQTLERNLNSPKYFAFGFQALSCGFKSFLVKMISPFLVIAFSPDRGRGVFTKKSISKGTVIEVSPVIVLNESDRKIVEKTILFHYIFEWGKNKKKGCVALGYVSMYNHSYDANCEYEMEFSKKQMTVKTVRDIKKGEELFVNYNAAPDSKTKVWFDTK
jgi:SET domain-containing protein